MLLKEVGKFLYCDCEGSEKSEVVVVCHVSNNKNIACRHWQQTSASASKTTVQFSTNTGSHTGPYKLIFFHFFISLMLSSYDSTAYQRTYSPYCVVHHVLCSNGAAQAPLFYRS
mgnify:CR=1 FL=1